MKVLLTGGCGFLGSEIASRLAAAGCDVCLYDAFLCFLESKEGRSRHEFLRRMRLRKLEGRARIERGDVRDGKRFAEVLADFAPECVIHLAAVAGAKECAAMPDEAVSINIDGTRTVLHVCKEAGCVRKFVFASSSYVYGHFAADSVDEELHPLEPVEIYGQTKLAGEILVRAWAEAGAFSRVIIRPSSVYGYGDGNGRITQICVENALRGKPVVLHEGGESRLDFTHVSDAAEGFVLAALRREADGGIFNVTRGRARSVAEFAGAVRTLCPAMRITAGGRPDAARPKRGTLSIARARRLLGYDPKIDIEEGAALYIKEAMADPELQTNQPLRT